MDRRMMSQQADNIIRVFVGKGVSGAAIIDNANRALSEPIPFTNEAPISIQWDGYSADNAKLSIKNTVTDVNTIDTNAMSMIPSSAIGTSATGFDSWVATTEERFCGNKPGGVWAYAAYPTSSGYIRLLFAGVQDLSAPIPNTISGNVTIKGATYRLVEAPLSDFI